MLNPAALGPLYEAAKNLDHHFECGREECLTLKEIRQQFTDALTLAESPSPVGEVKRWEMVTTKEGFAITPDTAGSYVLHTDYAALSAELKWAQNEFAAMIDLIPPECRVHVREGGGPENVRASCAVSVVKMAEQLADVRGVVKAAEHAVTQLRGALIWRQTCPGVELSGSDKAAEDAAKKFLGALERATAKGPQ